MQPPEIEIHGQWLHLITQLSAWLAMHISNAFCVGWIWAQTPVSELQQNIVRLQDDRPEFDIHKYGDCLMSRFADVGEEKYFCALTAGDNAWSICRKFAATLQLVSAMLWRTI